MKKYYMPETELIELNGEKPMCLDSISEGSTSATPNSGGDAPARIGSLGPGY